MWNTAVSKALRQQPLMTYHASQHAMKAENRRASGLPRFSEVPAAKRPAATTTTPASFFPPEVTRRSKMDPNTLIAHMFEHVSRTMRRLFMSRAVEAQNAQKQSFWLA